MILGKALQSKSIFSESFKVILQSKFMLFSDYTMTNIQYFSFAKILDFVPDGEIWRDRKIAGFDDAI